MITVEDLLMAYASAYDAWLDPEAERKNPIPEYAELIRQAVSFENAKLRELVKDMLDVMLDYRCDIRMPNSLDYSNEPAVFKERARELGIEVG